MVRNCKEENFHKRRGRDRRTLPRTLAQRAIVQDAVNGGGGDPDVFGPSDAQSPNSAICSAGG